MTDKLPENIINIEMLRINRNIGKRCKCIEKKFTVDANNRFVYCRECGALVDPYEAIEYLARHYEQLEEETKFLLEQRREIVNYKPHMVVFRNLERDYRGKKKLPCCPKCGEGFYFEEITNWVNRENEGKSKKNKE